jgi:hypothetical protein
MLSRKVLNGCMCIDKGRGIVYIESIQLIIGNTPREKKAYNEQRTLGSEDRI